MSRNSKKARELSTAKKFTELRKNGGKGPAKTSPSHGKKRAWWQIYPSYAAFLRGSKQQKQAEAS